MTQKTRVYRYVENVLNLIGVSLHSNKPVYVHFEKTIWCSTPNTSSSKIAWIKFSPQWLWKYILSLGIAISQDFKLLNWLMLTYTSHLLFVMGSRPSTMSPDAVNGSSTSPRAKPLKASTLTRCSAQQNIGIHLTHSAAHVPFRRFSMHQHVFLFLSEVRSPSLISETVVSYDLNSSNFIVWRALNRWRKNPLWSSLCSNGKKNVTYFHRPEMVRLNIMQNNTSELQAVLHYFEISWRSAVLILKRLLILQILSISLCLTAR